MTRWRILYTACAIGAVLAGCSSRAALPSFAHPGALAATVRTAPAATPTPSNLPVLADTSTSTSGLFLGSVCPSTAALSCADFAQTLRHGIALGTEYTSWVSDLVQYMNSTGMNTWPALRITPEITWMPNGVSFAAINAGKEDTYFAVQADELKALGTTIFLRPFHEFNGSWYSWGLPNQGADAAADANFINAWRRMVGIFHSHNASNVKFVWCFSAGALPYASTHTWDNPARAYPGDAYVDWVSFDTYNRGSTSDTKRWKSFQDATSAAYSLAVSISSAKPIAISETASNEYGDGGTMKASWIQTMFAQLTGSSNPFPHVRLLSWFEDDSTGYAFDTESSSPAYNAFVTSIRSYGSTGVLDVRSNGSVLGNITAP